MTFNSRGFTLIEAVIVLVLVAVISAIAIPTFHSIHLGAADTATRQEMKELQRAIMGDRDFRGYYQDTDTLPDVLSDLHGDMGVGYDPFTQSGGRRGAYVSDADSDESGTADILEDAWGNAYVWDYGSGDPTVATITSFGPDGEDDSGADDDIVLTLD